MRAKTKLCRNLVTITQLPGKQALMLCLSLTIVWVQKEQTVPAEIR